jgi:S1-C subfamily serine protease
MAEGLFTPMQNPIPGLSLETLTGALVRVLPRTWLVLDWAASAEEARARARNESMPDGSEYWYRFFLREDAARVNDPMFAMGMVRHEFANAIEAGATLPVTVPLDGGGGGFAISSAGLVLTDYHLVTSEIGNHGRSAGAIGNEVRCKTLRVQYARRVGAAQWAWHDADAVRLVSNPPEAPAVRDRGDGTGELLEDIALLRIDPAPAAWLELDPVAPAVGTRVWMAGFPLRTARPAAARAQVGYADADGTLRVSTGRITAIDAAGYFSTDCDGSMGNSGSPVMGESGRVLGVFSRATGDGPRNAFEHGHVTRVQVSASLAIHSLALAGATKEP